MGDFPGTGEAPEASQPLLLDHDHDQPPPAIDPSHELLRQQKQQKRSSLPARPNGAARHAKRLTLNFPINIPPGTFEPSVASPGSMTPITRSAESPVIPLGTPVQFDDKDDGSGLLTAIASQERRVLELREELNRAETELDSLKKQWAMSEKTKKRTEISYRAEPLIPLRSPDRADEPSKHSRERSGGSAESPVAQARASRELGRRHSMRAAASRGSTISANGRRVFQGSHTRALSLLSPVPGVSSKPLVSTADSEAGLPDVGRVGRPPRSATLPSSVQGSPMVLGEADLTEDMIAQWRKTMPPPSREALMRTGKQMASDLREGLWTFLEDIRQATVGEEGINATESRAMGPSRSNSSSRSRDRLSMQGRSPSSMSSRSKGAGAKTSGKDSKSADIDSSFWSEFGIDTPGQKSPIAHGASNTPSGTNGSNDSSHLEVDDNWDDWETTPQPKKMHTPSSSRSTLETKHDQSPMTQSSSPRTSASFGDWRPSNDASIPDPSVAEGIPWPAMTKITPSKLTRTASNLMAEWERSLSPPNDRRSQPSSPLFGKDDKKD